MPPVPSIPGRDVVRALQKAGFELARVRGSHHRLRNPDPAGTDVTVPVHAGRDAEGHPPQDHRRRGSER
jgi:predicted RNA binding protein YcfA (HicA-like mRNA interferase family)